MGNSFLVLYKRPSCQTLSEAWEMSRKTAVQYFLSSNAVFITSTGIKMYVFYLRLLLKTQNGKPLYISIFLNVCTQGKYAIDINMAIMPKYIYKYKFIHFTLNIKNATLRKSTQIKATIQKSFKKQ